MTKNSSSFSFLHSHSPFFIFLCFGDNCSSRIAVREEETVVLGFTSDAISPHFSNGVPHNAGFPQNDDTGNLENELGIAPGTYSPTRWIPANSASVNRELRRRRSSPRGGGWANAWGGWRRGGFLRRICCGRDQGGRGWRVKLATPETRRRSGFQSGRGVLRQWGWRGPELDRWSGFAWG